MGELARKPGCPEIATTPLELLTPRPGEGFSTSERLAYPASGIIGGVGCVMATNKLMRRPVWAGIPFHVLVGGLGYLITTTWRDIDMAIVSENDAVLKHYITLHPEDFPPYERKRWRDVYQPFKPIR